MSDFQAEYNTLVEIYSSAVERYALNPLFGTKVDGEWRWSTYRDFGEQVDQVRAALATLGVGAGDKVAIISDNRPEWAVAAYATYGRGAAFVPMYESQLDKDWEYILNDCGAKVLFVANRAIADRIADIQKRLPELKHVVVLDGPADAETLSFEQLVDKGKDQEVEIVNPDPESVAGFVYTSGTTGKPKGVLLTHKNLANNVSAVFSVFPLGGEDRSLSFLPWAHSFGQTCELHGMFAVGASIAIAESVNKIVANLAEVRPTVLFSVPRIFNRIYDGLNKKMSEAGGLKKALFDAGMANANRKREIEEKGSPSAWVDMKHRLLDKLVFSKVRERFGGRLKYAFSGGAALSKEVALFIDNLGIMVYEGYGLTETSPVATANWPGSRRIGSIGKPIPGIRVEIDHETTGDAVNGEIVVYGHNIMKGYHNLPEEDAKVFTKDGGFRTGDMGRIDEDGFVCITGRVKEQYKLENGKYVVPTPLEEKLKLSPFVANIMIYGDNKPYNVALIIPDKDQLHRWAAQEGVDISDEEKLAEDPKVLGLYADEIAKYGTEFKGYERPRAVALGFQDFTTDNGMLTPTLKLKRRVVLQTYGNTLQALYEGKADAAQSSASAA